MGYSSGPEPWCAWLMPLVFLGCMAMFGYTMYVNNCPENTGADKCVLYDRLGRFSFQPRTENFLFGPSVATLKKVGGLNRKLVEEGETWRLFSCMFLHSGVIHLLANMLSLLFTGVRLEEELGFLRIGVLYVLSGFGGSLLSCLHQDVTKVDTVSVGASGALFGFLGSMLSELITNWTIYANKCAALTMLLLITCINMVLGFIPGVDNAAHLGGYISGFLLGFVVLLRPQYGYVGGHYIAPVYNMKRRKPKYQCHQQLFWIIALVLLIVGCMLGLAKLYKGERIDLPIPSFPEFNVTETMTVPAVNMTQQTIQFTAEGR